MYTSYFAENVALFAIIVGIAMLLVGIGFVVFLAFARRAAPATEPPSKRRPTPRPRPDRAPSKPPPASAPARPRAHIGSTRTRRVAWGGATPAPAASAPEVLAVGSPLATVAPTTV